jgi:TonB-dependent starch-binding outer membrane protein SusC
MRKLHCLLVGVLLLIGEGLLAQTTEVTGKITDPTGAPIPNATIRIKSAKGQGGTSADAQGAFFLKVKPGAELIISAIGFETKEVKVGASPTIIVQMNNDSKSLSEVVVTGVGTATSKKHLGIAVESVGAGELPAAPTASIDQALIGKISGAQISSISGNPGDPVNILLRGINTVQGGTKPLIIVDGIEVRATDINSLDLSNVERVEVVKGAASSTLYGAQGANGVIQIFTKKGRKGPVAITYSTSYAFNNYINSGHLHKAKLHPYLTDGSNNLIDGGGNLLTYDSVGNLPGVEYVYGGGARAGIWDPRNNANKPYNANIKYTDQFKQVFKTGNTINNIVSISGANDKSDFDISISNNKTTSPILKNGSVDRTNLTSNLGFELVKGLKIRSVTQLIYTRNTLVPGLGAAGGQGNGSFPGYGYGNSQGNVGAIYGFLNTSPFFDLKYKMANVPTIYGSPNTPGSYTNHVQGGDFLSINSANPYYSQEYARGLDNKIDIVQSFDANYRVDKFLELDAKYGINWRNENSRWTYLNQSNNANSNYYDFTDVYYNNGTDNTGEIDNFQYNTTFQNFLTSATFKTDFQNDFHSKLPITTATRVGFDYRKNVYTEFDNYGYQLPTAPPYTMTSTSSQVTKYDYQEPFVSYGYLVDQSINFGDFAGIDGGFRSDWSSAFGGGSSPFTFPRINGFFEPSAFDFWKDKLTVIDYFKVRAAYGEAGIQPTPFQRYAVINQGDIGNTLTYSLQQSPTYDTKLKVEVTKETEVGTDFTIEGGKGNLFSAFNGSFTLWKRNSSNVIYSIPTALSTGYTGELANAITMESHGFEFSLNIPVYKSRDFNWDFTTNWGHQTSKIKTITGNNPIILTSNAGSTALVLGPGETIGQIYGHKTITNVNQTDPSGNLYIAKGTGGNYQTIKGALVDTATKQIQFTPDKYGLGDPNPKFNASFINSINYKFLTLTFQFDWIYGSHLYNQTKEWMARDGINGDFEKQVTINGQTGGWSAYWSSPYYNILGSTHGGDNDGTRDYYRESSSFLRLRNAALAFDITKVAGIKYFKKISLYVSGRNIWTKTKYTGFDPEVSSGSVNSAFDRGVDNSTMPNIKSYQAGLNVAF